MKMNGDEIPATFAPDDARIGYKNVEINCPSFNAACRRFLQSRGLPTGIGMGFGRGLRKRRPKEKLTEAANTGDIKEIEEIEENEEGSL